MKPLEGIKVVDLTTFLATPTTGRVLGEWGADVIKVEAAKGDPGRVNQAAVFGMPASDDENLGFDMANMHKRFISLNLKSKTGAEIMDKLLDQADIFITNTRTKSLAKMGFDWESVHKKHPHIIMGHGLGYGKLGPEKDAAGFDVTCYMGRGGVFGTTVNKGDAPMIPTNGYGDFQCSMFLAAGILAALRGREKTGQGDYVTCALEHAGIYALSTGMVSAQYGNPYPKSRLEVNNPLNNVFRSKDEKWVVLCLPEYDRDWPRVLKLIGREDTAGRHGHGKHRIRECEGPFPEGHEGTRRRLRPVYARRAAEDVQGERHAVRTRADAHRCVRRSERAGERLYQEGSLSGGRPLVPYGAGAVRAGGDGSAGADG